MMRQPIRQPVVIDRQPYNIVDSYEYQTNPALKDYGLTSGTGTEDQYISNLNCTALYIGVRCQQNGGTRPTIANICEKIDRIEIKASQDDLGGVQVSFDADDIPPLQYYEIGKMNGVIGTTGNDNLLHYLFYLPLSPDPLSPKFGYRDARIMIKYLDDPTEADNFTLTVTSLLHKQMPEAFIQMIGKTLVPSANAKYHLDLPENQYLMGVHTYTSTGLQDLSSTYAPTLDELVYEENNAPKLTLTSRTVRTDSPQGYYLVDGTFTEIDNDYQLWDFGWKNNTGLPIGQNAKLAFNWLASDTCRAYPFIANRINYEDNLR